MAKKNRAKVVVGEGLTKLRLRAGKPLNETRLDLLNLAVIQARVRRTSLHVFVDPEKTDSYTLHCLGLKPNTCPETPLRINRVEKENGGAIFVESRNGVQMVERECLLTAEFVEEPVTVA